MAKTRKTTKRSKNLFGFGKGKSKLQSSSRLEKEAYDAGYKGVGGEHGTYHFDAWVKGKQKGEEQFTSNLISRLRAEYKRGGVEYEADRLLRKQGLAGKRERAAEKEVRFKGQRIVPVGGGEWQVPGVDRESRFESLEEAKRFVASNPKKGKLPKERYMKVLGGYELDMHQQGRLVPPKEIRRTPGKDYGADPLGDGRFRMVPSGDIVDFEERNRRLQNPGPIESTYRSTTGAVSSVGKYLDRQLGRVFNPREMTPIQKRYYEVGKKYGRGELTKDQAQAEIESIVNKPWSKLKVFETVVISDFFQEGIKAAKTGVENPAELDRVKPTLTQGDSRAYVIELESRKYLAWVVDGKGERREKEFEGSRSKEAAKAWARLVLFEVSKADRKSNPEIKAMTAGQINKALDKLDAQDSKLTREFIDAGRGHELPSETFKLDDPLARRKKELFHKRMDLRNEMERRYGPGTPSRLPKGFGPIKANPEGGSQSMYESFHGRPSRETIEVSETIHYHENTAALGTCCGFLIESGSKRFAIGLSGYTWNPRADGPGKRKGGFVHSDPDAEDVILSSNEEGTQLFIDGGDQSLDLASLGITGKEAEHESIVIGDVCLIAYETEKEFDKFETIQYVHTLSEDSKGPLPVLRYMRRNSKGARMFLDGGVYFIEKPLVGTSPGIED